MELLLSSVGVRTNRICEDAFSKPIRLNFCQLQPFVHWLRFLSAKPSRAGALHLISTHRLPPTKYLKDFSHHGDSSGKREVLWDKKTLEKGRGTEKVQQLVILLLQLRLAPL